MTIGDFFLINIFDFTQNNALGTYMYFFMYFWYTFFLLNTTV